MVPQGSGPERLDLLVKLGGHAADLGLRDVLDAQGTDMLVYPSGGDAGRDSLILSCRPMQTGEPALSCRALTCVVHSDGVRGGLTSRLLPKVYQKWYAFGMTWEVT